MNQTTGVEWRIPKRIMRGRNAPLFVLLRRLVRELHGCNYKAIRL